MATVDEMEEPPERRKRERGTTRTWELTHRIFVTTMVCYGTSGLTIFATSVAAINHPITLLLSFAALECAIMFTITGLVYGFAMYVERIQPQKFKTANYHFKNSLIAFATFFVAVIFNASVYFYLVLQIFKTK